VTNLRRTLAALALASAASPLVACESAPSDPTWEADVAPILAANCVRCHAVPFEGAAPDGFRFDAFSVTELDDGRYVLGAREMAGSIAARVADRSMPPDYPLSKRQIEILERWAEAPEASGDGGEAIAVDVHAGPPSSDGFLPLTVTIDAADGLVTGRLEARGGETFVLSRELSSGVNQATFDIGAAPDDDYDLVFVADDEARGATTTGDASFAVRHGVGGAAPRITVALPTDASDASHQPLVTDADAPFTIDVAVADADGDDPTVVVEAVRGDQRIAIDDADALAPGVQWAVDARTDETPDYPEGNGWRIEVTASDDTWERTARSQPFSIGHATTEVTFAESGVPTFCGVCHRGPDSPDAGLLDFDFRFYGAPPDGGTGAYQARGRIYRRAILEVTMPPVSAELIFHQDPMPASIRASMSEWLRAGAPE
jgi:hypothetical protein